MNLQMTTSQKVVAAFIGMVFVTVGLGLMARLMNANYASNQKRCTVNSSQSEQLRQEGIASVDDVVCGTPKK